MDLLLKNKTAFISGSSQGIGYAIAENLAKEGVNIIINGRNEEKVNSARERILQKYPEITVNTIVADFANQSELEKSLEAINEVDILINNVGIFEQREFKDTTVEDWLANFNLNVMTGVKLSQHYLPKMLSKKWGRIIFVGSEFALNVHSNSIQYGVTKSAVSALSNGLSKLTKGTEVTVNTILAGATYSDGVAGTMQYLAQLNNITEEQMKSNFIHQVNSNSLLERFIDPEEIANIITFLSSPLSIAINGTSLRADAGNLSVV